MFKRVKWLLTEDRVGPEMILTHWILHFPNLASRFLKHRFANPIENVHIRPYATVIYLKHIQVGKNTVIRPFSYINGYPMPDNRPSIIIGDNVLLGPGVQIHTSNHQFSDPTIAILFQGDDEIKQVRIGNGSWIGANAIILPGVVIGENSVIGAGSVVTKDIPSRVVAAGVPARVIKEIHA
jgi:acetyltransferase-like isoleucine patch superfamily enzyme